jgi:phage-related protein
VVDAEKRVSLAFFRTDAGSEPVREWLLELPKADRRVVGAGLKELEFAWPIGMPLCRALGSGLFELRVSLRSRRIARVMVCLHDGELFALHGFIKKRQKTPESDRSWREAASANWRRRNEQEEDEPASWLFSR